MYKVGLKTNIAKQFGISYVFNILTTEKIRGKKIIFKLVAISPVVPRSQC